MPLPFNLGQRMEVGKNIHAINEVKQYGPKGPNFLFLLVEGGCWIFCCSQCVPMKFPIGSQHVPIVFPFIPNPLP